MSKKKKMNATPDSIVLGVCGEALLVMGAIVAFAGRTNWNGALTLVLTVLGLFLAVWGIVPAQKRQAKGDGLLTATFMILGAVSFVFGLLGFLGTVNVLFSGIPIAAAGIASDVVLAIVAKKEKNAAKTSEDSPADFTGEQGNL